MTAELKPYPRYKDSGVEWLGKVPAHWEVRRLKTLCSRSALYGANVAATSYSASGVRFLRTTDITEDGELNAPGVYLPSDSVHGYLLSDGDILVSRSGTIGRSFMYERRRHGPCAYAGYLVRFVPASIVLSRYILLFTKTAAFAGFLRTMAISSTIENVNGEKYANCPLPFPPIAEQTAIVCFLDHADRRIRRYIRAKQKLIELLEEQKQAVVHHAVTHGMRTLEKLRKTGNRWFPNLPAHWDVMPMRRVIASALDGPHHSPEYLDQGIPFLSARNIKADRWSLGDVKYISQTDYETFCRRVRPQVGDVLYTKGGTTGVARAVDLDYAFHVWVHIAVLKLRTSRILPRYLALALNTLRCYEQSQLLTRGATNQDLGLGRMKEIVLPVPPMQEQSAIIGHVAEIENRLGRAVEMALREIELLWEYRARLIADLVTGKRDVRGAAAELPEVDPLAAEGGSVDRVDDDAEEDLTGQRPAADARPVAAGM